MASCNDLNDYLNKENKRLLNFIYDGVYIVDTNRRIVFWNKGAEKITGYKSRDVVGKTCEQDILKHIDENGQFVCVNRCPLVGVLETGAQKEGKVFPMHKKGHRFPVSTHIAPVKNSAGKIIGAIEVFRDISIEEKFRVMEEKFKNLIKKYVSKHTFDSVVKTVEKDASEKAATKDLTVLFMDLVSFTTMSEKLAPDKIIKVLNLFFSYSSQVISKHNGDIDKFIGDCVMAVFIDANDAVKAAGEMIRTGLPALNGVLESRGLPCINVRIGINSGKLVQGNIGSTDRKDLTVIGDVVNTASRVEGAAEPGTFVISESVHARLLRPQDFVFFKEILLKGKTVPIKLFKPL